MHKRICRWWWGSGSRCCDLQQWSLFGLSHTNCSKKNTHCSRSHSDNNPLSVETSCSDPFHNLRVGRSRRSDLRQNCLPTCVSPALGAAAVAPVRCELLPEPASEIIPQSGWTTYFLKLSRASLSDSCLFRVDTSPSANLMASLVEKSQVLKLLLVLINCTMRCHRSGFSPTSTKACCVPPH